MACWLFTEPMFLHSMGNEALQMVHPWTPSPRSLSKCSSFHVPQLVQKDFQIHLKRGPEIDPLWESLGEKQEGSSRFKMTDFLPFQPFWGIKIYSARNSIKVGTFILKFLGRFCDRLFACLSECRWSVRSETGQLIFKGPLPTNCSTCYYNFHYIIPHPTLYPKPYYIAHHTRSNII